MSITHRQLEEAQEFINCGIKEGWLNEESFEDLTDEEFVRTANEMRDRGDSYAEEFHDGHAIGGCFVCKDGI